MRVDIALLAVVKRAWQRADNAKARTLTDPQRCVRSLPPRDSAAMPCSRGDVASAMANPIMAAPTPRPRNWGATITPVFATWLPKLGLFGQM